MLSIQKAPDKPPMVPTVPTVELMPSWAVICIINNAWHVKTAGFFVPSLDWVAILRYIRAHTISASHAFERLISVLSKARTCCEK